MIGDFSIGLMELIQESIANSWISINFGTSNEKAYLELISPYFSSLVAVITAIIGIFIGAKLSHGNEIKKAEVKGRDVKKLIIAELENIKRHYSWTCLEIEKKNGNIPGIFKISIYNRGRFMFINEYEPYGIDENMSSDLMQILMFTRNNDLMVDILIELLEKKDRDEKEINSFISDLKHRYAATVIDVNKVLSRMSARRNGSYGEKIFEAPKIVGR